MTRVGVLGTGDVGRRLAAAFAQRDYEVMIGSRDPDKPEVRDTGLESGTFEQAAQFGELVVLAVLGVAAQDAIRQAGPENFAGKVVIDATNPLDFSQGTPPRLAISGDDSLGEQVQRALPDAKVVKAFNIIGNPFFADPSFSDGQPTMLIAGEDEDAKRTVDGIVQQFGWPPAFDVGGIDASRELESLCILWVRIGFQRGAWDHAFKLLIG